MTAPPRWKSDLFRRYVSTGQAGCGEDSSHESSRAYAARVMEMHFPADRATRILDLGCGQGAMLFHAAARGYRNASGVDISPEQIAVAHERGVQNVRCADLFEELRAQATASVGLIILMDVLEHLTRDELFEALAECRRVLMARGRCIAHVPNAEGLFGMRIRYGDLTHELAFTPSSARQCFGDAGFSAVRCYEERPLGVSLTGMLRNVVWQIGTMLPRVILMAETGVRQLVLSQNMLVVADVE